MLPRLYDAHNHLQDARLASLGDGGLSLLRELGVVRMVVNGSCEADWPAVLDLGRKYPEVLPSFGYHPWYVKERTPQWQDRLAWFLDQAPSAIGEIGLDRWVKDHDLDDQQEVFVFQWRLAAERGLPVSIHCLQAWGRLLEILQREPRLPRGFVLHSFGGPQEMIGPLADLGAFFSLPGYFAQPRKERQRETFRHVPLDRLLIETDAPDQNLPPERVRYPLKHPQTGADINHPANLPAVYEFASELLGQPLDQLAGQVERNFEKVFGGQFAPKQDH